MRFCALFTNPQQTKARAGDVRIRSLARDRTGRRSTASEKWCSKQNGNGESTLGRKIGIHPNRQQECSALKSAGGGVRIHPLKKLPTGEVRHLLMMRASLLEIELKGYDNVMLLSRKALQRILGVLWLIDGLLQVQPQMWTMNMVNGIMKPMLKGQPGLIE